MSKRSRKNAEHILDALRNVADRVSWNTQGEIIFNGQCIRGSHVFDLIKNVTAPHNVSDAARPVGWDMFLKTLADLNITLSVVPNIPSIRRTISGLKSGVDTESQSFVKKKKKRVYVCCFQHTIKKVWGGN